MSKSSHRIESFVFAVTATCLLTTFSSILLIIKKRNTEKKKTESLTSPNEGSYEALIGNTPLICLKKASSIVGNGKKIYVKMESLNPGGTGKDRAALSMILNAQKSGHLPPEKSGVGVVVEGTSGSTGISLASLCASKGYSCIIFMPDDQAKEKRNILECLGAEVNVVPTAAISNPKHYVNLARQKAEEINKSDPNTAAFMNQFENTANFNTHYRNTGPEILDQMNGKMVDAFVMSSGTGGTLAGVGSYLKEKNPKVKVVLVDPPGSSLYNKIKFGVAFAEEQRERLLRRHRYDTIAEGVGLDRVTSNFALGVERKVITDAIRVTDQEMVDMAHWYDFFLYFFEITTYFLNSW